MQAVPVVVRYHSHCAGIPRKWYKFRDFVVWVPERCPDEVRRALAWRVGAQGDSDALAYRIVASVATRFGVEPKEPPKGGSIVWASHRIADWIRSAQALPRIDTGEYDPWDPVSAAIHRGVNVDRWAPGAVVNSGRAARVDWEIRTGRRVVAERFSCGRVLISKQRGIEIWITQEFVSSAETRAAIEAVWSVLRPKGELARHLAVLHRELAHKGSPRRETGTGDDPVAILDRWEDTERRGRLWVRDARNRREASACQLRSTYTDLYEFRPVKLLWLDQVLWNAARAVKERARLRLYTEKAGNAP